MGIPTAMLLSMIKMLMSVITMGGEGIGIPTTTLWSKINMFWI